MQVTKEPLEPCQVALTIEVEGDKVVSAVDKAYREYAKYVAVPGFRKGKAPMNFVRQRVPESDVRQRAAETAGRAGVRRGHRAGKHRAVWRRPSWNCCSWTCADKPFIFKAVVPLASAVELGQYAGLTVEHKKYEIDDEDVDKQLERMRERAADYPKVERPVEQGDLVVADVVRHHRRPPRGRRAAPRR